MTATVPLHRDAFREAAREVFRAGDLRAEARRTAHGVEALRLSNGAGWVEVLPFLGAMVWDAGFGGRSLRMQGKFEAPRPAAGILGTYGCLLFHAGLLRNGCPGPEDAHPLHGEAPCAPMDSCALEFGEDAEGAFLRAVSAREHAEGFGPRYLATPSATLRPRATVFGVEMAVRNLAGRPMDLMYMAHANFAFLPGARLHQPAPWTQVRVRTAVPGHVTPSPDYLARLAALAEAPERLAVLDPALCDPEQVFYIGGPLTTDAAGWARSALVRPEGDGFVLAHRPADFPVLARWLLHDPDERVAAFALPSTCEPEGHAAEHRKGHVRSLAPGEARRFPVRLGWLDAAAMLAFLA
jgi:hypothetical protein